MSNGWISVHRQLQQHWLWEDKPFSKGQAWIDLLLLANHEDSRFLLGNQLVEAARGEVITSEVKLMERWGWSKAKVRAFLDLLQNDSMIIKKTDSKKTSINIVKYGIWQDIQTEKEPQKDHKKTAKRPQKDTINNNNNSNNDNKFIYSQDELEILEFWNSKEIVIHNQTKEIKASIQSAIKKYGKESMLAAIGNYSAVFQDKSYFYNHTWRLDKFLKQENGLPEFLEDGQQWLNYKAKSEERKNAHWRDNGKESQDNGGYAAIFDK